LPDSFIPTSVVTSSSTETSVESRTFLYRRTRNDLILTYVPPSSGSLACELSIPRASDKTGVKGEERVNRKSSGGMAIARLDAGEITSSTRERT
jgi:hypothetical protein